MRQQTKVKDAIHFAKSLSNSDRWTLLERLIEVCIYSEDLDFRNYDPNEPELKADLFCPHSGDSFLKRGD